MADRFVDLSHAIEHGLVTYPGLPAPAIDALFDHDESRGRYGPGTEFHIGRITMVANTGTYLDAPFHRFRDGADIAELELARLADLPGVLLTAPARERSIGPELLPDADLRGQAVLVRTDWSRHWGRPSYFDDHPFLTEPLGAALVERGAALVGIDSLNIDDTLDGARPVHTALLRAGIPIVEHLTNLAALPPRGFRFSAVPARVRRFGTFPVRAFAVLP